MKMNKCKKYLLTITIMMLFLMTGCKNNDGQNVKESPEVSKSDIKSPDVLDSNTENKNNSESKNSKELTDGIYKKLSDADKEMIIDLQDASISKVILESDNGIKKVNENIDITGKELYKAVYKTNDATIGDFIVYADTNDLSILGYGLLD
ncbi:MAG: hypothetical protein SO170_09100 [Butyribacter sp.]|nr:hypothetical protein [bacterium]MDY3855091.1 hypothetical protein [Butyribacter sp.]